MLTQRLRHRVTIQERQETQDAVTGEILTTWVDFMADVPAEVLTGLKPGKESILSAEKQAMTTARINFRWIPGVNQNMRAVWDGRRYDIADIDYDRTARREIRLTCTEGLNDG